MYTWLVNRKYSELATISILLGVSTVLLRDVIFMSIGLFINFGALILYGVRHNSKKQSIPALDLIVLIIPFLLVVFGLLSSQNISKGTEFVFRSVPLILVPVFYLSSDKKIIQKGYGLLEVYFPAFVLVIYYIYVLIGLYFKAIGYGDYLYYSKFSQITNVHTTYMALIVVIATFLLIKRKHIRSKLEFYGMLFGLIFLLFLFVSKISFVALFIILMFDFYQMKVSFRRKIILFTTISIIFSFLISIHFETRLSTKKLEENENLTINTMLLNLFEKDIKPRALLWKSNILCLEGGEVLFGMGTGSDNKKRLSEYKKNDLKKAIRENFNAHNQFIECFYLYGLIGFSLFLYHCFYILKLLFKSKNWVLFLGYSAILVFFTSESILNRSVGIVLYSYMVTFIYFNITQRQ